MKICNKNVTGQKFTAINAFSMKGAFVFAEVGAKKINNNRLAGPCI